MKQLDRRGVDKYLALANKYGLTRTNAIQFVTTRLCDFQYYWGDKYGTVRIAISSIDVELNDILSETEEIHSAHPIFVLKVN